MPVVPGVLLDHVHVDPAQVHGDAADRVHERLVQGPARGRGPGQLTFPVKGREIRLGAGRLGQVEVPIRVVVAAVQVVQPGLACEAHPEPGLFHLGHVPDQPEQGQAGRRHGPLDKLLAGQSLAFHQQRAAVEVQPAVQRLPLAGHRGRIGAGYLGRGPCHAAHPATSHDHPQRNSARAARPGQAARPPGHRVPSVTLPGWRNRRSGTSPWWARGRPDRRPGRGGGRGPGGRDRAGRASPVQDLWRRPDRISLQAAGQHIQCLPGTASTP